LSISGVAVGGVHHDFGLQATGAGPGIWRRIGEVIAASKKLRANARIEGR
jgi:hypothetical protein